MNVKMAAGIVILGILLKIYTPFASHQNTKQTFATTTTTTTSSHTFLTPNTEQLTTATVLTTSSVERTDDWITLTGSKVTDAATTDQPMSSTIFSTKPTTTTTNTAIPPIPSQTSEPTTSPATVFLDAGALFIHLAFTVSIDIPFSPELKNSSSTEYNTYAVEFLRTLMSAFETMTGFSGINIESFSEGSVVCSFELELEGSVNLTNSEEQFYKSLNYLDNATVFGEVVQLQKTVMKDTFSQAAEKQMTGIVCEIYKPVEYCELGYTCRLSSNLTIICELDCSSQPASCLYNGGTCVFDRINNQTICICTVDACEKGGDSLTVEAIIAIVSVIVTVVVAAIPLGYKIYKNRRRQRAQLVIIRSISSCIEFASISEFQDIPRHVSEDEDENSVRNSSFNLYDDSESPNDDSDSSSDDSESSI